MPDADLTIVNRYELEALTRRDGFIARFGAQTSLPTAEEVDALL